MASIEQTLASFDWRLNAINQTLLVADRRRMSTWDTEGLDSFAFSVYSQNGEDGVLNEILNRIDVRMPSDSTFVEIGCGNGLENNTAHLLAQGWRGLWVDVDEGHMAAIRGGLRDLNGRRLDTSLDRVTLENAKSVLRGYVSPDVLSLDIDGNDWHILQAMLQEGVFPKVIIVEYNAGLGPVVDWVMPYDVDHVWAGDRYYGASIEAWHRLLSPEHRLVHCEAAGINAFFVRADVINDSIDDDHSPSSHWRPLSGSMVGYYGQSKTYKELNASALQTS